MRQLQELLWRFSRPSCWQRPVAQLFLLLLLLLLQRSAPSPIGPNGTLANGLASALESLGAWAPRRAGVGSCDSSTPLSRRPFGEPQALTRPFSLGIWMPLVKLRRSQAAGGDTSKSFGCRRVHFSSTMAGPPEALRCSSFVLRSHARNALNISINPANVH